MSIDWSIVLDQIIASAIVLWPVELAVLWMVYKVRVTVRKTSAIGDVMPDLEPRDKVALAWSIRRAIKNEVKLYEAAKARGEVR